MRYKQLFGLSLFAVLSILMAACSQEDESRTDENSEDTGKEFVYNMHFDGDAPGYSDSKTRATTSWTSGSVVYLWLKKGSTYILGTATYTSGKWVLKANSSIPATSSSTECKAVYVSNAKSVTSSAINLSPKSIYYYAVGSYTSSSTDIYVKATLQPKVWRLRFKGTYGKKITLPASNNDIMFYSKINLTSTFSESTNSEDVSLTVNTNGYTDYIYGVFNYPYGSNKLYVKNDSEGNEYYMERFSGTKLAVGRSGYLIIPTSSNYNTYGWKKAEVINPNATVQTNEMYVYTDGMCTDWNFGSSAYKFYYKIYLSSSTLLINEDNLINDLTTTQGFYLVSENEGYIFRWPYNMFSNTSYCLCALAYDKNGNRGPIFKKTFTTRKTTEPIAEIMDIETYVSNKWYIYIEMKNGSEQYYCRYNTNEDDHKHFIAWDLYHDINTGRVTTKFNSSPLTFTLDNDYVNVITVAVNSIGSLGNYDIWQGRRSNSSGAKLREKDDGIVDNVRCMKKSDLLTMDPIDDGFYIKKP